MATIYDVAKYFLHLAAGEADSSITPLKLQKLCYYAQSWNLAWDGRELFPEDFQAWAHGPANPALFDQYRNYKWLSIELEKMSKEEIESKFNEDELETIDVIWEDYGIYDGKYLEKLTHQEDPWIKARGSCSAGEYCSNIISKESMKNYYSKFLSEE